MQTESEDKMLVQQREAPLEASGETLSVLEKATVSLVDTEKIENLTVEVENLKVKAPVLLFFYKTCKFTCTCRNVDTKLYIYPNQRKKL